MICPKCAYNDTRVLDSRDTDEHRAIRRRRECEKCDHRFTTFERIESYNFIIIKSDNSREPYNREKIETGIWKACEKRQVTQDQVKRLIDELEADWARKGKEISSKVVGEGIMEKLRDLDEVAYIRFASVYRKFKDLETFEKELKKLSSD